MWRYRFYRLANRVTAAVTSTQNANETTKSPSPPMSPSATEAGDKVPLISDGTA